MKLSEAIMWLGSKQVELYHSAPEVYIRSFRHGSANRDIISQYYGIMVRKGLIMPLETTEPGYKAELKLMAIEFANGELDLTGCLNMAKLLHIISHES